MVDQEEVDEEELQKKVMKYIAYMAEENKNQHQETVFEYVWLNAAIFASTGAWDC
jgi:hypothetical protein